MIKNILFDMDGVLVNSERAIRTACIRMLGEHGVHALPEDFRPFTGMGEIRFIGGVAEKYGLAYLPGMKDRAYEIYAGIAGEFVTVYPGIPELIRALRERGFRLAVASAADLFKVEINLRCIGLSPGDFDGIVTGSEIKNLKPAPDIFLEAAARIGADPAEALVVEDAVAGVQAALAAGMKAIAVTTSFDRETLLKTGASETIAETRELLRVLDCLNLS
jgi:HAD superfamily hydrolase (TIGR01509 family)